MTEQEFDLYEYLDERAYPKAVIDVYLDEQSGYEIARLSDKYKELEKTKRYAQDEDAPKIDKELKALKKQLDELSEKVRASALKFDLLGLPGHVIQSVHEKHEVKNKTRKEDNRTEATYEITALMIQKVTSPDGREDTRTFDYEGVEKLIGRLPSQGVMKLMEGVTDLMMASMAFDNVTDAGFLAKS